MMNLCVKDIQRVSTPPDLVLSLSVWTRYIEGSFLVIRSGDVREHYDPNIHIYRRIQGSSVKDQTQDGLQRFNYCRFLILKGVVK